jgi:hypothetical protein
VAQRLAAAAWEDGARGALLEKLKGLGSAGRHPANCERDFHRAFAPRCSGLPACALAPCQLTLPMLHHRTKILTATEMFALRPLDIVEAIHSHRCPGCFRTRSRRFQVTCGLVRFLQGLVCGARRANNQGCGATERCLVGAPMSYLEEFWRTLAAGGEAWVKEHPLLDESSYSRCVPIFIHGDEAKYIQKDEQKACIFSLGGLAHGSVTSSRFLITALPCDRLGPGSLWAFLEWLTKELENLQDAVHLPHRYVVAGVKGDAKFVAEAFHFPRAYNRNNICRWCLATKTPGPLLWTDVSAAARWPGTFSPAPSASPLMRCRGITPETVWDDMFHILWIHGVGNDLCGSTLVLIARLGGFSKPPEERDPEPVQAAAARHAPLRGQEAAPVVPEAIGMEPADLQAAPLEEGDDQDEGLPHARAPDLAFVADQLLSAYAAYRAWCRRHNVESGMETFTPKGLHCVSATSVPQLCGKGVDVRTVLLWLHDWMSNERPRLQALQPVSLVDLGAACQATHLLAFFVHRVSALPVLLPATEASTLRAVSDKFLRVYLALASQAVRAQSTLYKVRPKGHSFWHLGQRLRVLSPKVVSTMLDETLMGTVARIAGATHRRTASCHRTGITALLELLCPDARCAQTFATQDNESTNSGTVHPAAPRRAPPLRVPDPLCLLDVCLVCQGACAAPMIRWVVRGFGAVACRVD